jgi:surface carbohydrate biosynthesis protein
MKFKKIQARKIDVLIVDKMLSEYLCHCIPKSAISEITPLPSRGVIPWIPKFNFFLSLISAIKKYGLSSNSFIISLINITNPSVVITYIDNNPIMGKLLNIFPDKLIISIQNGVRVDNKGINFSAAPVYYGFGNYEYELYRELGISISEYHPVGSYKMGVFLSDKSKYYCQNDNSISFVSQFRKYNHDDINNALGELFFLAQKFCLSANYKIDVLMVCEKNSPHYLDELNFFKNRVYCKYVNIVPNNSQKFTSYSVGYASSAIISISSTLAMELFGCGVRVLFCFPSVPTVDKYMDNYRNKLPSISLTKKSLNYADFNNKISFLLSTPREQYAYMCKKSMNYVMMCQDNYPHLIIKRRIQDFMTID